MKITGKQNIEYWLTRSRNGALIRVYRIDPKEDDDYNEKMGRNAFDIPILVESFGMAEGIAEILEHREKLQKEVDYYGKQVEEARRELFDYKTWHPRKKWWEFWK